MCANDASATSPREVRLLRRPFAERRAEAMRRTLIAQLLQWLHRGVDTDRLPSHPAEKDVVAPTHSGLRLEDRYRGIAQRDVMLTPALHAVGWNDPHARPHIDLVPSRADDLARPCRRQDLKIKHPG